MKSLKSRNLKAKFYAIVAVLTLLFVQFSLKTFAQLEDSGGDCDTYCRFYNPNYDCRITYVSGNTVTCSYRTDSAIYQEQ